MSIATFVANPVSYTKAHYVQFYGGNGSAAAGGTGPCRSRPDATAHSQQLGRRLAGEGLRTYGRNIYRVPFHGEHEQGRLDLGT